MKINSFLKLIICITISESAGILGSFFTISAIPTWYASLQKPFLNPPAWIFGPVWVTLYLLMGISLWLIWKSDSKEKKKAIRLFLIQLVLNAIWSPIFFGGQSIGGALAVIVLLWAVIVLAILVFTRISKVAAWLLIPYILWVSFAGYLNFMLFILNH
ncbi:MAG: tryptophan-rich sensory protein [Candidatus Staskawiczbacteria bacterium]|nr:tryptophan-rich sensory protein [Candidatus Staskawiczbacteria bacterium]